MKMTTVEAIRDVHAPFSATVDLIKRFHKQRAEHRIGPHPLLRASITCEIEPIRDYTDPSRLHEALIMRWKAKAAFPFPVMRGLVTVRPQGLATRVRMEGTYQPPLGRFGSAFDQIVGRRIAMRTIERFLDEVYAFTESEYGLARTDHHLS